jgi:SAM-dependent methyltransferase
MNIYFKAYITEILRKLKLISFIDKIRFYIHKFIYKKKNKQFLLSHPNFVIPPDYLLYEAFRLDYFEYYDSGIKAAEWLKSLFEKYVKLQNAKILDWGCGPARIIRHLPYLIGNDCEFYGTDYNARTIDWCKININNVIFNKNELAAKLPYPDNFFDVIYGLSIFTHLSESKHHEWASELLRVLKKYGILLVSTQGNIYKNKLTIREKSLFESGSLVVRESNIEGHRVFSTFQPPQFMRKLFCNQEILEHIIPTPTDKNPYPQDIWIIRKIN